MSIKLCLSKPSEKFCRACRMLWSFSRDGAVPGWQLWSAVNPLTKTPINAVLFMCTLAFILGLPMLNSTAAFFAVTSISVIGLYISCKCSHTFSPGMS